MRARISSPSRLYGEQEGADLTSEQTLDGEQEGADVVRGGPLLLEDVQADVALLVDIRVEAGRREAHHRGREGVVVGEVQPQLEVEALVYLGWGTE